MEGCEKDKSSSSGTEGNCTTADDECRKSPVAFDLTFVNGEMQETSHDQAVECLSPRRQVGIIVQCLSIREWS